MGNFIATSIKDGPKSRTHLAMKPFAVVRQYGEVLIGAIIYDRDYNFDFFGFKTLERSYLLRAHGGEVVTSATC